MREQFGSQPASKPEGMLREIIFPELALMDVKTGEMMSRVLDSEGRGVRELPRTIYAQFQGSHGGESPSTEVVGALHEVVFEDGVVSGRGWLLDDDNGRRALRYIKTGAMRHNSVDLSEVKGRIDLEDMESGDPQMVVHFTEWKIGATTLVGKPAFANAHAVIGDEEDELVASWYADDEPLIVDLPNSVVIETPEEEVVASGVAVPPWEYFHQPEADKAQKLTVGEPDENGWIPVAGHLGTWESCHDGYAARCVRIPRPSDNYASFNKPGVLTDRGLVETGPIFLSGGHRRAKDGDYASAYGGIENAWADVRVTVGKHGPWLSGVVRPGVEDAAVYAARASRISGHWLRGSLKAIVSVNAEGYEVPGSGFSAYEFSTDSDNFVVELVAGFPACDTGEQPAEEIVASASEIQARVALALALEDDET